MDPMRALGSSPALGLDPSLSLFSGGAPALTGAAGLRSAGLNPVGNSDSMMAALVQNQMVMSQSLLQLMQMMLQLMANRSGADTSGSSSAASPSAISGSSPSGGSSAASGGSGVSSGGVGQATPTDTGKKLADIARAEATNGDSQGGLCYRDVARSLAKIGINCSGASAYMAADQLAKNDKVTEVKVSKEELPKLPAGAIVVWDRGNGHEHGHISIATGDGKEASDLMRTQITNYGTSFRVFMPK